MEKLATTVPPIDHLVIDSSALIHRGPIGETGKQIYCCNEIVAEIKDKATRDRLQILPYEVKMINADLDAIQHVVEYSKKTGDYKQLSAVDLKLIAITFQLEKRFNGLKYIHSEPRDIAIKAIETKKQIKTKKTDDESQKMDIDVMETPDDEQMSDLEEASASGEDDDEGWITPDNIAEVYKKMGLSQTNEAPDETPKDRIRVACMTSDFSIQNCMMQMGLLVVSPKDGLMIKEAKKVALRCHACYKVLYDASKAKGDFCPHCGNLDTLKRVNYSIDKDGNKHIYINYKRDIRVKGNNKSLPLPRGGKHSKDPILAPDQPIPKERDPKLAILEKKMVSADNVLSDPAYLTRTNPFANHVIREVNKSRAGGNRFVRRKRH